MRKSKNQTVKCLIIFNIILILLSNVSFAQFQVKKSVIANGGVNSTSSNFKVKGTVNEVFIGNSSSTNSTAKAGFWNFYFDDLPSGLPVITTSTTITSVGTQTATVSGEVVSDGGFPITERGIVYSTTPMPDIDDVNDDKVTSSGLVGSFDVDLSNLYTEMRYYYRAYAINQNGIKYGTQREFWTLATEPNHPATFTGTTLSGTSVKLNFQSVAQNGTADGYILIKRDDSNFNVDGFVDGSAFSASNLTNGNEYLIDLFQESDSQTEFEITGLTANTTYHFMIIPYAVGENVLTTNYNISSYKMVSIATGTTPTVVTNNISSKSSTGGTLNGNVTSAGRLEITERGFIFADNENLDNSTEYVDNENITGAMSKILTGLTTNQTFYYKAFATNSEGTSYGEVKSFTTTIDLATEPTVQSKSITFNSVTKNRIGLRWTKGNGSNRIVLASLSGLDANSYPEDGVGYTTGNFGVNQLGNFSGVFVVYNGDNTTCLVEGLSRNTTYYFRIMEYNGSDESANYLQTTASGNPSSRATSKKDGEEIEITQAINVYPNPVKDNLTIDLNIDLSNSKLTIMNDLGQVVYSTSNLFNSINLNTTEYANGVYHILITGEEETMYHSFVIER